MFKGLRKVHIITALIAVSSFFAIHMVSAVTAEPGSTDDPLVTQSYVDSKVDETYTKMTDDLSSQISSLTATIEALTTKVNELDKQNEELDKQNQELKQQIEQTAALAASKFVPVQVKAGQKLIAGESTEFIVRVGKATGISGVNGDGLSDVTTDTTNDPQKDIKKNIVTGQEIPLNHLIFVARDDGRGFTAVNDVWIIIKGTYEIQ